MPHPIFLQSGYQQQNPWGSSESRPIYREYTNKLWTYLDSLIVGENNGQVLLIGDYWLTRDSSTSEVFDFVADLGWTARIVGHNDGIMLEDRGIEAVFEEMAAGTYAPRLIYVEDVEGYLGTPFTLTSDQLLFLRTMAESGTTALHIQISLGIFGEPYYRDWVEVFTDGQVKLAWDDADAAALAGGYPPWGAGHSDYIEYGSIEYWNVDDKPPMDTLASPGPELGRLGWGWFVPQGYPYASFMEQHAIIVPDRDYTDLFGLPGTERPASSILDFPRPLVISGRRKDVDRRFITP